MLKDENFNQRLGVTFSSFKKWFQRKKFPFKSLCMSLRVIYFQWIKLGFVSLFCQRGFVPCQGCGAINPKSVYIIWLKCHLSLTATAAATTTTTVIVVIIVACFQSNHSNAVGCCAHAIVLYAHWKHVEALRHTYSSVQTASTSVW